MFSSWIGKPLIVTVSIWILKPKNQDDCFSDEYFKMYVSIRYMNKIFEPLVYDKNAAGFEFIFLDNLSSTYLAFIFFKNKKYGNDLDPLCSESTRNADINIKRSHYLFIFLLLHFVSTRKSLFLVLKRGLLRRKIIWNVNSQT